MNETEIQHGARRAFELAARLPEPLVLRGDEATVMVADLHPLRTDVHLVLDWACGGVTHLDARVRRENAAGRVVDLDLQAVAGDWQPFLDYLGAHTS